MSTRCPESTCYLSAYLAPLLLFFSCAFSLSHLVLVVCGDFMAEPIAWHTRLKCQFNMEYRRRRRWWWWCLNSVCNVYMCVCECVFFNCCISIAILSHCMAKFNCKEPKPPLGVCVCVCVYLWTLTVFGWQS